jgi:hypothetical protein
MDNDNFNDFFDPHVQHATMQIAMQIVDGEHPQISDAHNFNEEQRAIIFCWARSIVARISNMSSNEIAQLIN